MDYNAVVKTIKITNEEGIWDKKEAVDYITKNWDINNFPYGQVFHIWNVNPSGDEWNDYFVSYDGKLVNANGDQFFYLDFDFTKNITDICAKYPEYTFSDELVSCLLPDDMDDTDEECYQLMSGYINGKDKVLGEHLGDRTVDNELYDVCITTEQVIEIINKLTNEIEEIEMV